MLWGSPDALLDVHWIGAVHYLGRRWLQLLGVEHQSICAGHFARLLQAQQLRLVRAAAEHVSTHSVLVKDVFLRLIGCVRALAPRLSHTRCVRARVCVCVCVCVFVCLCVCA
jgi:hypothetical protein